MSRSPNQRSFNFLVVDGMRLDLQPPIQIPETEGPLSGDDYVRLVAVARATRKKQMLHNEIDHKNAQETPFMPPSAWAVGYTEKDVRAAINMLDGDPDRDKNLITLLRLALAECGITATLSDNAATAPSLQQT